MWTTLKENCHIDDVVKLEDEVQAKEKELSELLAETKAMDHVVHQKESALRGLNRPQENKK